MARETDIPALLDLQLAIDADQAKRFGDDRYTTTISEKSIARSLKSSRMVVATRRGRIVGTVNPTLQRTGIGRQLIEYVKQVAKEWPVAAIRLDAYDGPAGGGPFYSKCGFKKLGHATYRGVPLVYYEFVF